MCASVYPCMCTLLGRWLGFRIVSGLAVINMPGPSGPEKIYHNQEGRQSAHGRKRMVLGVSGKRNEEERERR